MDYTASDMVASTEIRAQTKALLIAAGIKMEITEADVMEEGWLAAYSKEYNHLTQNTCEHRKAAPRSGLVI
tara:strand:+ start:72 stop:284 length:213 start_codon:yes stop_codon:yes gene_type:complete